MVKWQKGTTVVNNSQKEAIIIPTDRKDWEFII